MKLCHSQGLGTNKRKICAAYKAIRKNEIRNTHNTSTRIATAASSHGNANSLLRFSLLFLSFESKHSKYQIKSGTNAQTHTTNDDSDVNNNAGELCVFFVVGCEWQKIKIELK